ncbi:hypothetical protein [Lactiplantibacillus pingfangensis]|uniref:hypothetical protein n=1 Tax=Lactiplantibacillus pingfangensis TaxID=2559915 RepID=UPI0010F90871|nr:hypothetical protein [Lactiplantibacillus pingfangensis]
MTTQRQELITLINTAYQNVQTAKFTAVRAQLGQFSKDLSAGEDEIKIMLGIRNTLLQADLSLTLKNRIAGLPVEYQVLFETIDPALKKIDSQVIDRYTHYGFVPLKFGSTVKYP